MRVSFDIDEFLAYLLSGALMLAALHFLYPNVFSYKLIFPKDGTGVYITALGIMTTSSVVLILGHLSSIINRYITRPISRLFVNPREKVFRENKKNSFWSPSLLKRIHQEFEYCFCYPITNTDIKTAPRLIRTYVLNKYNATLDIRNRIVRARSLCGNSILPIVLFAVYFFLNSEWVGGGISSLIAIFLLVKQIDLDNREWKEIYSAFVIDKNKGKEYE